MAMTNDTWEQIKRLKRRVYIVGCFNRKKKGAYFFGPASAESYVANLPVHDKELRKKHTFTVADSEKTFGEEFSDLIEPVVLEYLDGAPGYEAVAVGAPANPDEVIRLKDAVLNPITPYLGLFDGDVEPASSETGIVVYRRLQQAADGYLELLHDQSALLNELSAFLYRKQPANWPAEYTSPGDESCGMPSQFKEIVFDYLLKEDRSTKFAPEWLDGFELEWLTSDIKNSFADRITEFKKLLLDGGGTQISDVVSRNFQKNREALIYGAKTIQSRLMLAMLQRWVLHYLLGEEAEEACKAGGIAEQLEVAIHSKDESKRGWQIPGGPKVSLAKPQLSLSPDLQQALASKSKEKLKNALAAIVAADEAELGSVKNRMEAIGWPAERVDALLEKLGIVRSVAELKCKADDDEGTKERKRAKVRAIFEDAWNRTFEAMYLPRLFGEVVESLSQFEEGYVDSFCSLYVIARQFSGESGKALGESGDEDQRTLESLLGDRDELEDEELDSFTDRMTFSALQALSTSIDENTPAEYEAIELYARIRATKLLNGIELHTSAIGHDTKSLADGLGVAHAEMSTDEVANEAKAIYETADNARKQYDEAVEEWVDADGSIKEESAEGGADDSAEGDSSQKRSSELRQAHTEKEKRDILRERKNKYRKAHALLAKLADSDNTPEPSDEEADDSQFQKPDELPNKENVVEGAKKTYEHSNAAMNAIWGVYENASTPDVFSNMFRQVALKELMLAKGKQLQFGKAQSRLYTFAADLISYGEDGLKQFLENHSLTKYFEKEQKVGTKYSRLEKQTIEASEAMSLFTSEVNCVKALLDSLPETTEVVIYNGTASEFSEWVRDVAVDRQLWNAKVGLQRNDLFFAPLAVYLLDSALTEGAPNPESVDASSAYAQLRTNLLQDDGYARPPVIFGSSKFWSLTLSPEEQNWWTDYRGALEASRTSKGMPAFVFGPAVPMSGGRDSELLVRPTAFCAVEFILTGQCSTDYKFQNFREKESGIDGVYDLSGGSHNSISDHLNALLGDSLGGKPSLSALLWVYLFSILNSRPHLEPTDRELYAPDPTRVVHGPFRNSCQGRDAFDVDGVLEVPGGAADANLLSVVDNDGKFMLHFMAKSPTANDNGIENTAEINWY